MSKEFPRDQLDPVLGAAGRLLVEKKELAAAEILANSEPSIEHWDHDNWDGGQDTWRLFLAIPARSYLALPDREAIEKTIDSAIAVPMEAVSSRDFIETKITTALESDSDWRSRVRQHLSGKGINNQGRAHSNNVAARSHDGLLFRSLPEVYFYSALKAIGVPFAPLSVVVGGGTAGQRTRRIEPDFIIYRDGLVTVVEIDGDLFHKETPAEAHARLKFLTDEGPRLERIAVSACDTPQKAREAADRIMLGIEKRLRSRA
jgi:hypothetical protein